MRERKKKKKKKKKKKRRRRRRKEKGPSKAMRPCFTSASRIINNCSSDLTIPNGSKPKSPTLCRERQSIKKLCKAFVAIIKEKVIPPARVPSSKGGASVSV